MLSEPSPGPLTTLDPGRWCRVSIVTATSSSWKGTASREGMSRIGDVAVAAAAAAASTAASVGEWSPDTAGDTVESPGGDAGTEGSTGGGGVPGDCLSLAGDRPTLPQEEEDEKPPPPPPPLLPGLGLAGTPLFDTVDAWDAWDTCEAAPGLMLAAAVEALRLMEEVGVLSASDPPLSPCW